MEGQIGVMEVVKVVVQWVIVPVVGFVWLMHKNQQMHQTDIAVLKAVHEANKQAHDREFKEMRENFKTVFSKLDNIEQALRS